MVATKLVILSMVLVTSLIHHCEAQDVEEYLDFDFHPWTDTTLGDTDELEIFSRTWGGLDGHGPFEWKFIVYNRINLTTSMKGTKAWYCGGTLIDYQWVLTSGNCATLFNYVKGGELIINLYDKDHEKQETMSSGRAVKILYNKNDIVVHPGFVNSSRANNIALIRLRCGGGDGCCKKTFEKKGIVPVLINDKDYTVEREECYIGGWGNQAKILKEVIMPTISGCFQQDCRRAYALLGRELTDDMFCAGYYGVQHLERACAGDVGTGLLCRMKGEEKWVMEGVTVYDKYCANFPDNDPRNLFVGLPGIYSRISKNVKWIHDVIKTTAKCDSSVDYEDRPEMSKDEF